MRVCLVISGLFLLLLPGITGCRAKKPGKIEGDSVYWLKRNITVGNKKEINPIPLSAENIQEGKESFGSYCMVCHGLDAQNTGVPFAATMSPPVPSLASAEVQAYTDGQLKWIIENGIYPSGMPPSKGIFSDDDIWRMVLYIRHLPRPGSLGDPIVYGGDGK
jgi:mono/diheme cytochrome c family protein